MGPPHSRGDRAAGRRSVAPAGPPKAAAGHTPDGQAPDGHTPGNPAPGNPTPDRHVEYPIRVIGLTVDSDIFGYLPEEIRTDPTTGTVITVPAAFNQMQKDATMSAADQFSMWIATP